MDRYERILTLHRLLKSAHYPIPLSRLMDELECSRATLYRDVAFLRDALGAPIESAGGEQAAFRYEVGEGETLRAARPVADLRRTGRAAGTE